MLQSRFEILRWNWTKLYLRKSMIKESDNIEQEEIFTVRRNLALWGLLNFLALSWFPFCHSLGWRMMGSKYRNGALSLSGKKWHGTCRRKSWLKKYLYLNMYEIYIWTYRNGAFAKKWHWELQKKSLLGSQWNFPPDGAAQIYRFCNNTFSHQIKNLTIKKFPPD